eukprot:TRINITY_DN59378_c0_g1_i1.p1 TRINITY_DN59378_c0_g1~~TRINITY_DN59378_c0_g1_i1.p1  ORF type:complete len:421 (-),score=58.49 TRINITY_DN59378_c0_g1_i1:127-1389(-)
MASSPVDSETNWDRLRTPSAALTETLLRAWMRGLTCSSLDSLNQANHDRKLLGTISLDTVGLDETPTAQHLYEIEENALGAGSFGVACPSRHRGTGTQCIVKMVSKVLAGRDYREHLVEAGMYDTLLSMSQDSPHANIVRYLDMLEGPEYYYVVMERLQGPDLFDHLIGEPLASEDACRNIMRQVLSGLRYLHDDIKIFHRDVKLDNFRFRQPDASTADLALLDLGFARPTAAAWDRTVAGTLMYLAPEVAKLVKNPPPAANGDACAYGPCVDVWAAGIVLFILLAGEEPFTDDQVWSLGAGVSGLVKSELQPESSTSSPAMTAHLLREGALSAQSLQEASTEAVALLHQLLTMDPGLRPTAAQALEHPWFKLEADRLSSSYSPARAERYSEIRSASLESMNLSKTYGSVGSGLDKLDNA